MYQITIINYTALIRPIRVLSPLVQMLVYTPYMQLIVMICNEEHVVRI